jgi:hypothetical protein
VAVKRSAAAPMIEANSRIGRFMSVSPRLPSLRGHPSLSAPSLKWPASSVRSSRGFAPALNASTSLPCRGRSEPRSRAASDPGV